MYEFEPGVAYCFTPCFKGVKSFVAVAVERCPNQRGVEFVVPNDLIIGDPIVLDGREIIKVEVGGQKYCASAALPLDMSAAFALLDQVRSSRERRV